MCMVVWLSDGTLDAATWFERDWTTAVSEWAYTLTDTAGGHSEVSDMDTAATAQCGDSHGCCLQ